MINAIVNSFTNFVSSALSPALYSAHVDCELSYPDLVLVAAILDYDLTNAQREEFVNDYIWVSCPTEIDKDMNINVEKELFIFDAVLVKLVRFAHS